MQMMQNELEISRLVAFLFIMYNKIQYLLLTLLVQPFQNERRAQSFLRIMIQTSTKRKVCRKRVISHVRKHLFQEKDLRH